MPTSAAFSVDTARALPGPDWLRARRAAAAEQFASAPWPSADEEIWRYSRVADLDLDTYAPAGASSPAAAVPDAAQAVLDLVPQRAGAVVVVDGHIVHVDIADRWAAKGLALGALADDTGGEDALGQAAADPPDVFAQLNDAFTASPVLVRVPAGLVVDDPVLVVNIAAASGLATFPRLVVTAGADSQADVLDIHRSGDRPANLVLPVTELIAEQAARLGFVAVQDLGLATWQIASQVSRVDTGASLVSATAALGAEYARQRTDCRLEGRGASGTLLAAYFGEGDQTLDFRTFQDHAAPDTTSDLLFKGAVGGRSRSVYTGLIRVRKNARGTNAFQTNRNLKLSDDAWAQSVPNLEIENNDVRCSHASAVGPIDEEQRFYLESRGVPPAVTERLVVMGFFDEVLERLPVGAAVPPLRGAIAGKLARQDVDE